MPVSNSALGEVIGRHFKGDAIAGEHADSIASQLSSQVSKNCSILIQLNAKQSAREFFNYGSSNFYAVFFTHSPLTE